MSETDDWVLPAGDVAAPSTPAAEVNDWQPAAPEPSAWDQMSWPERAGHQLRSGVETAGQIANTQRALGAATGLRSIGETAANWGAEATRDPEMAMAYRQMFPPRGERDINRLRGVLRDSAGNVIASRERQSQIPSSPNAAAFAEDFGQGWNRFKETWSPGEFGPAWERFKANPGDIAGQAIIPGLPVMAGAVALPIGAAALGMGTIPVLVAQFGGSAATRLSANSLGTLAEAAKQDGVNIEDADAVARWMVTRPDRVQGAVTKAGQGALAGALVDTLALGFSRPIIPRAGLGANARALGQDLAVGMVQPPAAEVASQLGMDGGIANPGGVGMAAAAGAFQGPMNAGIRSIDAASAPRIPLNYRPPGTPPAEAAGSGQPQLPPPTGGAPPGAPSGATPPVRPQPVGEAPAAAPPGGVRPYAEGAQVMVRDPATGGMVPATVRMVSDDGLHAVVATDPMDPMTFRGVAVTELQPVTNVTNVAGEYTPPLPAAPSPAEVFASGLEQATSPAVLRERQQLLHEFQTALPEGFTLQERPGGWALTIDGDPVWEVPGEYPAPEHYAEFRDILSRLANVQMPGTPAAPVQVTAPEHIAAAGAHVTQPTPGQAQAGNYPMGHVTIDGLPITIETPAGGIRSGIGEDGQPWSDEQPADYGYIKRTKGADGDRVDVYLGPAAHEAQNHPVFIIDQIAKGTGKFDEHKAMIGFPTQEAAVTAYHAAFGDGSAPERIGAVTRMPWPDFKRWATSGQTQKPLTHQDTEAPEPRSPEFQAERQLNLREGRPISLVEFLARTGGIRDPRGDLRAMDAHRKFIPGAGMLVRQNGRSLDYAREAAAELGYLPQSAGIDDFLALIDEELRGFPVYAGADLAEMRARQEEDAVQREREAIAREAPAIRLLARQRGYDLTKDEVDVAAWFVVKDGLGGDEAIYAASIYAAELADAEAGRMAPLSYRVEDHELEGWAEHLGLTLTPEQYQDATDLWMDGWEAPQAVVWAAAVKPAIDAEAEAATQDMEIPFAWSTGDVGRLDEAGAGGEPGEAGGGGERLEPGDTVGGEAAGAGGEPAGPESAPASEPPADSEQPGDRPGPVRGEAAGDAVPEPQPEGGPATEPTTRPGFEGGDQFVIPGTGPRQPEPNAGEQQPSAGTRPAQGPQGGIGGLFEPNAGAQTDLVDAVRASRDVGNIAAPSGVGLAESFRDEFLAGKSFATILQARKTASDWLGGPVQAGSKVAKVVDEAIETGAVMAAREIVRQTNQGQQPTAEAIRNEKEWVENPENATRRTPKEFYEEGASRPSEQRSAVITSDGALYEFVEQYFDDKGEVQGAHATFDTTVGGPTGYIRVTGYGQSSIALSPTGPVNDKQRQTIAQLRARYRAGGNGAGFVVSTLGDPGAVFDRLLRLYEDQMPRVGTRTADSIERQAYSTPLPLAYAASRLAGASTADVVYEPTAGNGALLIEVPADRAFANELDPERQDALKAQGFDPTGHNALSYTPPDPLDVVLANPPFGKAGDIAHIDHDISMRALEGLRRNGRAVLIVGSVAKQANTEEARRRAYRSASLRSFYTSLYGNYRVTDHFTVPGDLYAKQGAAWPVDVIVIEGRGKSSRALPAADLPRVLAGWDDLREITINAAPTQDSGLASAGPDAGGMEPGPEQPAGVRDPSAGGPGGQGDGNRPVREPAGGEPVVGAGAGNRPRGGGDTGGAGTPSVRPDGGEPTGTSGPGAVDTGSGGGERPAAAAPSRPDDAGGLPAQGTEQPAGDSGGEGAQPATVVGSDLLTDEQPRLTPQGQQNLAAPPPDTAQQSPLPRREIAGAREVPTKPQVPYRPRSTAKSVDTLVPANLSDPIHGVLAKLDDILKPDIDLRPQAMQAGTGFGGEVQWEPPLDEWVAKKLGYDLPEFLSRFSAEQVDALALAIVQVDSDAGFVIGDQTGIGKGRFVAGMIRYALSKGLTPIFVTQMDSLYKDMARDLIAIGMEDALDKIFPTNNGLSLPLTDDEDAPVLRTPTAKQYEPVVRNVANTGKLPPGKEIVFTLYSQLQTVQGQNTSRQWMLNALAPNAFFIMDESHNAAGTGNAPTGGLPRSRFVRHMIQTSRSAVYSSATWTKRPNVMDLYAMKTDLRLAVEDMDNLGETISRGGVPMQQIITAQLAQVGQFIRRERDFTGITYEMTPAPVDHGTYNNISRLMAGTFDLYELYVKPWLKAKQKELDKEGEATVRDSGLSDVGVSSTGFGSVMHNVIAQMLLASKADEAANQALKAIEKGEKPIITVANTMGKFLSDVVADLDLKVGEDFDLSFGQMLDRYLERQLRYKVTKGDGTSEFRYLKIQELGPSAVALYNRVKTLIRTTDLSAFPASPIDHIKGVLQKAGHKIGEITGRDLTVEYQKIGGARVKLTRRAGRERTARGKNEIIYGFNSGPLDALIINQAGSAGISLHASIDFQDRRPRTMIVAQAEQNIDLHMQILGRPNRTGQVVLPRYVHLLADVPAEMRPAAVLAKKMASLSAATTSARRGMLGSNETADFMNEYGAQVAFAILAADPELSQRIAWSPRDTGDAVADLAQLTGRIPLLEIEDQQRFYAQLNDNYKALIEELDAAGENALEAKTLDLRAKVLETIEIKPGAPGNNPFSAPVYLERMDVRRTQKPPAPYVVVQMVQRGIGMINMPLPADLQKLPLDDLARLIAGAAATGSRQSEFAVQEVDNDLATNLERVPVRFVDPDARKKATADMNATADRVRSVVATASIGSMVTLSQDGAEDATALVLAADPLPTKNHAAPSGWEFTLLTHDGVSRRIQGAQMYGPAASDGELKQGWRRIAPAPGANVVDFLASLKEQAEGARETRFMITGNLLAGLPMVSGQIVNYTNAEGAILQGILLARSFSAPLFFATRAQVIRGDLAKRWLADREVSPPPFLVSSDGVVTISATDQADTFFLDLPLSKKEGGDYYLDRFLRDSMDKQEFVSRGNKMRGTFSARMVNRVVGGIESILKRKEAYLVSPHPAAKLWAERVGAAARGVGAAIKGALRDERGALDMDALFALLPQRMRDYLMTHSQGIAARAQRRWNTMFGRPSNRNITIEQPPAMKHLGPVAVELKTPERLFVGTGWEPIIRQGILAEEKQSDFIHRLSREYVQIRQRLNKAGGSFDTVSEALFAGDAMEIALTDTERLMEHFNEWNLAPSEIRAYRGVHNLLQKVARLVDMHNRSMMPGVLRQKREVWERMERILNQKRVTAPEARALYAERARLGRRVKNGKGDVAAAAARIDEINALLRQMRAEDPDTQAELNELQDTYDQLEARLAATGVRNRRAGYIPHKFFGNYRLWQQDGVDEEGNVQWREITSAQGFYSTMSEALTAAESIYAQNPDAILRIAERQVRWPDTLNGTELTDRAFFRFQGKLQESLPDATDAEIRDLLKGVARRRFRRRIYAPGMFRKGYQGYSEDLDRVMRTHIGQSVRYVIMDKLKHDYINRYERAGFSRSDAVLRPEQRALKDALDSWFRDVNGSKQKWEERLDNLLLTPAGPAKAVLTLGAGTLALGLAAGLGPILSPAVAGWLGWRMWKATKESGQFPTRTFQNAVLSDQAHLKLGMILNLHSALVNLTQTTLNTLPVMGTKYTAIGVKRATAALWAQATSKDSLDAVRLQRANIHTSFHLSDADRHLAQEDSKVARISMMAFQSVETFNRAVAYFAGLAKAEEEGLSVGRAHLAARAVVRRTQFHMGNANKPALLRKQFLRAPTQFKNFQFQEIAFAFGLDRKELPKFLLSMFLHAGVVGLPGMQLIDAMTKTLSGVSLSDAAKESVLKAATYGNYAVNAATMAAYGLPGYYHALTSSVGMGQNFLPTSPRDLAGPLFGTAYTLTEAEQKGAGLVDRLQVISPSFKTLKALEYAANGNPITSLGFWEGRNWQQHTVTDWRRRGQTVYHPDLRQLLMLGAGFTPIEQTIMQDAHYRTLREAEERRRKADVVLARIAQLTREGRSAEIGAVVAQARQDGIRLTQTMIQNARKGVFTTQPDRDLQRTPRDLRMEQYQRTQAIKGGLAPPAATE